MVDSTTALKQLIDKLLLFRGNRDVVSRVFPPTPGKRSFSVILERDRHREQFFLDAERVEQFARTGLEIYVLTDIRIAFRNMDKVARRKQQPQRKRH